MEVIKEFINQWGIKAEERALKILEEYKIKDFIPTEKEVISYKINDKFASAKSITYNRKILYLKELGWIGYLINRYENDIMYAKIVREFIDKEKEIKLKQLLAKVENKIGNIIDASGLYIAEDGNINGFIVGDKTKVKVETIYAGGYNIQSLHFRILLKIIN